MAYGYEFSKKAQIPAAMIYPVRHRKATTRITANEKAMFLKVWFIALLYL